MTDQLKEISSLRHLLHQYPEVSNEERNTAIIIKQFIENYGPDKVIEGIGGHGIVFVFEGKDKGPSVAIRAELDALPIQEINVGLPYISKNDKKGHKCGHDGHMAMVAGLADWLHHEKPKRGRVILLFQPAEETGEGAARMLQDPRFEEFKPDYIFALHNLPGYPRGQIIVKQGVFNAASKGLSIRLEGKTAHAAEPENGISPAGSVSAIIDMLGNLITELDLEDQGLVTLVHVSVGEAAFGVSPGSALLMLTIRAFNNHHLKEIQEAICSFVKMESQTRQLKWSIEESDSFRASVNDTDCVQKLIESAEDLDLPLLIKEEPLRWSEDFGLFTEIIPGAMFGLGAGENTPDLHNPDYDFPNDILSTGISMYRQLISKILSTS